MTSKNNLARHTLLVLSMLSNVIAHQIDMSVYLSKVDYSTIDWCRDSETYDTSLYRTEKLFDNRFDT